MRAALTELQRIPTSGARAVEVFTVDGLEWHAFRIGDTFFVAPAEHADASVLYRWDGERLRPHQTLAAETVRYSLSLFP